MIFKRIILLGAILLLTSCSSVGLPPYSPAKAKINQGIYTSKIGTQPGLSSFSVKVPQASDAYELTYLKTKEEIGSDVTYVSFGGAALDFTVYRAMVGAKGQVPFGVFKEKAIPMLESFIAESYKQPLHKIVQKDTHFKGQPAIYVVYTQTIDKQQTLTHAIYIVYYEKYVASLWVQASSVGMKNIINNTNRNLVINETWEPQAEFVNSFKLY